MIFIGIDDTDNPSEGGTGRVARDVAAHLAPGRVVIGVTRHQLLRDDRIPYTSNNSCNVIHVLAPEAELAALADEIQPLLGGLCLPGSDPGLCVAAGGNAGHGLGRAAQSRLVSQAEAQAAALERGAVLRSLGGSGDGIIGAMAGAILAAGGSDGRFVAVGGARDLTGVVPVAAILAAGVAEVRTPAGDRVTAGRVDTGDGRARPLLRRHLPVLLVEPDPGGDPLAWRVLEPEPGHSRRRSAVST